MACAPGDQTGVALRPSAWPPRAMCVPAPVPVAVVVGAAVNSQDFGPGGASGAPAPEVPSSLAGGGHRWSLWIVGRWPPFPSDIRGLAEADTRPPGVIGGW